MRDAGLKIAPKKCFLFQWERTAPVPVPLASVSKINSFSRHGYIKIGLEVKACFNILKESSHSCVHLKMTFIWGTLSS
jgi:hypothetical protein